VKKSYLAIVVGVPDPPTAKIDAPIGRNLTDRTRMSILKTSVSREAQTTYRTLDHSDDAALLACDLHTGRTHQIRVHLRSINHPILGDPTYATSESKRTTLHYEIASLCLHSWMLAFDSPAEGDVKVIAPVPEHFAETLKAIGLHLPRAKK
jgi:23S rRNA pseudouridine1911/1915/1917 synthase